LHRRIGGREVEYELLAVAAVTPVAALRVIADQVCFASVIPVRVVDADAAVRTIADDDLGIDVAAIAAAVHDVGGAPLVEEGRNVERGVAGARAGAVGAGR